MNNTDNRAAPVGRWQQGWSDLQSQWRGNARLRLGLWLIAATLWVWLLLMAQDQAKLWRGEVEESRAELDRLSPLRAGSQWPKRAEEARLHLEAAREMLWTASSQGQAEAELQDKLRSWSSKAGIPVRELAVSAVADGKGSAGVTPLRARMVLDMNRMGLMILLSELGRAPQRMVVESLRVRPFGQPARVELDVKVLYRPAERQP